MEKQEIAVPILHHSIVSEHELMVGDVLFRERKEMIKNSNDAGDEVETELVHVRYIGDESLKVTQTLKNGELEDEKIDHNLENDEEAVENFKNEWENGWHPSFTSTEDDDDHDANEDAFQNKLDDFARCKVCGGFRSDSKFPKCPGGCVNLFTDPCNQ